MRKIDRLPNHIAIILDGNGRWAKKRGLPRSLGHYNGAMNLVKIANYADQLGIKMMSVYAFSTENWNRPSDEVNYLMTKPVEVIHENIQKIKDSSLKICVKGRRDRISKDVLDTIVMLEEVTSDHQGMVLNICFDYGSHDELLTAFSKLKEFNEEALKQELYIKDKVDLLIRTGGELRLSNFLLWQAAYAELYFTKKYWPDFSQKDLYRACLEYSQRNRRFGGIKNS